MPDGSYFLLKGVKNDKLWVYFYCKHLKSTNPAIWLISGCGQIMYMRNRGPTSSIALATPLDISSHNTGQYGELSSANAVNYSPFPWESYKKIQNDFEVMLLLPRMNRNLNLVW